MRTFADSAHHEKFSVIVSLDKGSAEDKVSETIGRLGIPRSSLVIKPDQRYLSNLSKTREQERRVDDHLFFALRQDLESGAEFIALIEDDFLLSPDFLQMLVFSAKSLQSDPSLFCISGWNEHAYHSKLLRTGVSPQTEAHWRVQDSGG